jgi:threonine dehydratase
VKREDLSPINAYKWRGAHNRMALLTEEEHAKGVVAASAGNHAQGVALAARHLEIQARVYMPRSTPLMKQAAVALHGGRFVEVILHGDDVSESIDRALLDCRAEGRLFIHPYDDLQVMGGQGTMADEVVMSGKGPFDIAYLQIGGGGMAAAVACWLKAYYPEIRIVGVEGVDQASMGAAVDAGRPTALGHVDVFCDGTAIRQAGEITFPLCAALIDELMTVTNEEVCAAIQTMWETMRVIPEPSGAMGLAGLMAHPEWAKGKRALVVLCGANMDFGRLAWIARHAGIGAHRRRYYRIGIPERRGSLVNFLEEHLQDLNITEFQHGKGDEGMATYVLGIEASPPAFALLERRLKEHSVPFSEVTGHDDVEFRVIRYRPDLFRWPFFMRLDFPERAGALHDFLVGMSEHASICYFNYVFTGETIGRALIGVEFDAEPQRDQFRQWLARSGAAFREVDSEAVGRML